MKIFFIVAAMLTAGSPVSAQGHENDRDFHRRGLSLAEYSAARSHAIFNQNKVDMIAALEKRGIGRSEVDLDEEQPNRCSGGAADYDDPPLHVHFTGKTDGRYIEGSFCYHDSQLYNFGW